MKTYLVTGGAGFIGANFVEYILDENNNINIIVLDKLTYAGNLDNLLNYKDKITFIKGDICNEELVEYIFNKYNIDYVVNFAAESHVDRSIESPKIFLETNILGTQNLLESAKKSWTISKDNNGYPIYKNGVKFVHISTDEVYGTLEKDYEDGKIIDLENDIKIIAKDRESVKTFGNNFFTEKTPIDPRSPYSASKASSEYDCIFLF